MAASRVNEGDRVTVRESGATGTVASLTPQRTGSRGRPKIIATVKLDTGDEGTFGLGDLRIA